MVFYCISIFFTIIISVIIIIINKKNMVYFLFYYIFFLELTWPPVSPTMCTGYTEKKKKNPRIKERKHRDTEILSQDCHVKNSLSLLCHSLLLSLSSSLFFNKAVCLSALFRQGPPAMWKVNPCESASRLHLPGNPLAQADSRTTLTSLEWAARAWPATWGWASLNHFCSIPSFQGAFDGTAWQTVGFWIYIFKC